MALTSWRPEGLTAQQALRATAPPPPTPPPKVAQVAPEAEKALDDPRPGLTRPSSDSKVLTSHPRPNSRQSRSLTGGLGRGLEALRAFWEAALRANGKARWARSPAPTQRAAWPCDPAQGRLGGADCAPAPGVSLSACLRAGPRRHPRDPWVPKGGQGQPGSNDSVSRLHTPPSWSLGSSKIPSWGHLEKTEDRQKLVLGREKQTKPTQCHFLC